MDISKLSRAAFNKSKAFQLFNVFAGNTPLLGEDDKPIQVKVFSVNSNKVHNDVLDMHRNGTYTPESLLVSVVDCFVGKIVFEGKPVTKDNQDEFITAIAKDENFSWLADQIFDYARQGDFTGK